jgi:ATP-binding cassette subfamily C protein
MAFSKLLKNLPGISRSISRAVALASYLFSTSKIDFIKASFWMLMSALCEGAAVASLYPAISIMAGRSDLLPYMKDFQGILELDSNQIFIVILGSFILLTVAGALATRQRAISVALLMSATMTRARVELFQTITQATWSYLSRQRTDDLTHLINGEIERLQTASGCVILSAQNLTILIIYAGLSFLVSPSLSLIAIGIGLVLFFLQYPARQHSSGFGQRLTLFKKEQYRLVGTFLSAIKTIKAYSAEDVFVDGVKNSLRDAYTETNAYVRRSSWSPFIFTCLSALALASLLAMSFLFVHAPVATVGALLLIFGRIVPKFGALQDQAQTLLLNLPAFEALESLKSEARKHREITDIGKGRIRLESSIELRNVCFSYGRRNVINSLSLEIKKGAVTLISGPSGVGKSTLADLVMGLLEPTHGEILVDGKPMRELSAQVWRTQIAYVPQETQIFNASLRQNLTMGAEGISDLDIEKALIQARASEFTNHFSDGLDTELSPAAMGLSGGQKQRIAIARAIIRRPDLFIFDEPTSALDPDSTEFIMKGISSLRSKSAILIISHDPKISQIADTWVKLEEN